MERNALQDDTIGGFHIPKGSIVVTSPWILHHNPELWPEPDRFDPDRFLPEAVKARHNFAYIPFGGGPRKCIGSHFAMLEAQIVLATLGRVARLSPTSPHPLELEPLVTLRPQGGLAMLAQPRVLKPTQRPSTIEREG